MPTQLDRHLQSKNLFFGFAGLVTAVSAWVIWGPSDIFPKQDPAGEPELWTESQLRDYLKQVGYVRTCLEDIVG
ncbi:hypothetical protein K461DRAFT_317093 [Myriangium duriaei CBS 260.36]|uniref:STE24 endopeptidase n=1 Tax=Myriangium duriaei CBS 260.36 TaxID=1168546 RepID=A0A9P4JC37_9PEZI|nr:hypothetical protein K461DRAFT_317093 [Myriangium duriaei CBS 260.36]